MTMLDESQMTVAGAIQCRYPTLEFDLEKSTFYLEKKSHFKKSVSIFLFLSSFSWKCAPLSFHFLFKFPLLLLLTDLLQEADCPDFHSELLV